jgi:hypothetical protein
VKLAREKYKLNKVLEVGDKVQELKKTHKWFLELASHSPEMYVPYKWISNVTLPYVSYLPFLKFNLGLLSHLNLMLYIQYVMS